MLRGQDLSFSVLFLCAACSANPPAGGSGGRNNGGSTGGGAGGASAGSSGSVNGGSSGSGAGAGGAVGGSPAGGTSGSSAGGAAGTTAGSSGSAGTAGTGGGSGFNCGAIFTCDNFEATPLGAPNSTTWHLIGNTPPQVVDGGANGSAHSVTVAVPASSASFIAPKAGFPAVNNSYYIRARGKFATATSMHSGHSWFIVGSDAPDNGSELRLGVSQNATPAQMLDVNLMRQGQPEYSQFSNGFVTGGNPGDFPGTGYQWQADTWYCFEAFFDGQNGEFNVWIDGVEVPNMHVTDWNGLLAEWSVTYNYGKIGAQVSGNLGQVWWDDVAYSPERIGCDCACQ